MAKRLTMGGLFKIMERLNHTPQEGLNDKVRVAENVVVKLGLKGNLQTRNTSKRKQLS